MPKLDRGVSALLPTLLLRASGSVCICDRLWHLLTVLKDAGLVVSVGTPGIPCVPNHHHQNNQAQQPQQKVQSTAGNRAQQATQGSYEPTPSLSNLLYILRRRRCSPFGLEAEGLVPHACLSGIVRHGSSISQGSEQALVQQTKNHARQKKSRNMQQQQQQDQHQLKQPLKHAREKQGTGGTSIQRPLPASADPSPPLHRAQLMRQLDAHLSAAEKALACLQAAAASTQSPALHMDPRHLQTLDRKRAALAAMDQKVEWLEGWVDPASRGKQAAPMFLKSAQICSLLQTTGRLVRSLKRRLPQHQLHSLVQLAHVLTDKLHAPPAVQAKQTAPKPATASSASLHPTASAAGAPDQVQAPSPASTPPHTPAVPPLFPRMPPAPAASPQQGMPSPASASVAATAAAPPPRTCSPGQPNGAQGDALFLQSLGQALEGLACVSTVTHAFKPTCPSLAQWLEAAIPGVSHAHALELSALYVTGVGPLQESTARALTGKLTPWLASLVEQARQLPPGTDYRAWMDTALRSEPPLGVSASTSGQGPGLLSILAHKGGEPTTPLGRVASAVMLVRAHSPLHELTRRMEALALELASCLPGSLSTWEVGLLLERGAASTSGAFQTDRALLIQALSRIEQLQGQALSDTILAARRLYVKSSTRAVLPLVFDAIPPSQALQAAAQPLLRAYQSTVNGSSSSSDSSSSLYATGSFDRSQGPCSNASLAIPNLDLEGQMQQLSAALLLRALASAKQHIDTVVAAPAPAPDRLSRWMEPLKQMASALTAMDLRPLSQPQVLRCALPCLADLVPHSNAEALAVLAKCTSTLLPNWAPLPPSQAPRPPAPLAAPHSFVPAHQPPAPLAAACSGGSSTGRDGGQEAAGRGRGSAAELEGSAPEGGSSSVAGRTGAGPPHPGSSLGPSAGTINQGAVPVGEQGGQGSWEQGRGGDGAELNTQPGAHVLGGMPAAGVSRGQPPGPQQGRLEAAAGVGHDLSLEAQAAMLWHAISCRLQALLLLLQPPRPPPSVTSVCAVLQGLEQAAREGPLCSSSSSSSSSSRAGSSAGPAVGAEGVLPCSLPHPLHAGAAMQAQRTSRAQLLGSWGVQADSALDAAYSSALGLHDLLQHHQHHPYHLQHYQLRVAPAAHMAGAAASGSAALPFVHAMRAALPALEAGLLPRRSEGERAATAAAAGASGSGASRPLPGGSSPLHSGEATVLVRLLCMYAWHRSHWGAGLDGTPTWRGSMASPAEHARLRSAGGSTARALGLLHTLLPRVHTRITSQLQRPEPSAGGGHLPPFPPQSRTRWLASVWCREVAGLMQAACMAAHALAMPPCLDRPPLPPLPLPPLLQANTAAASPNAGSGCGAARGHEGAPPRPAPVPQGRPTGDATLQEHEAIPPIHAHTQPQQQRQRHHHQQPSQPTAAPLQGGQQLQLQHGRTQPTTTQLQHSHATQTLEPHPSPHPLLHLWSKMQPLPVSDIAAMPASVLLHVAELAACGLQHLLVQRVLLPHPAREPITPRALYTVVQAACSVQPLLPLPGLLSSATSLFMSRTLMQRVLNMRTFHKVALTPSQLLHMCLLLRAGGQQQQLLLHPLHAAPTSMPPHHAWVGGATLEGGGLPPSLPSLVLEALAGYARARLPKHLTSLNGSLGAQEEDRGAPVQAAHGAHVHASPQAALPQSSPPEEEVLGHAHLLQLIQLLQPNPAWPALPPAAPSLTARLQQDRAAAVARVQPHHPLAYLQQPELVGALAEHVRAHRSLHGVAAGELIELLAGLASLHTQLQQLLLHAPAPAAPAADSGHAPWGGSPGKGPPDADAGNRASSSSSVLHVFLPLVEAVAEALLPALPHLSLPLLSVLGQQTWAMLAAAGSGSGSGIGIWSGLPLGNSSSSSSFSSSNSFDAEQVPPQTQQGRLGAGAGAAAVGWGAGGAMGARAATAAAGGLVQLAAVHEGILAQLDSKMQELYLLPAEAISTFLRCLVSARLCTLPLLALSADALAWQLRDVPPATRAALLLSFMHARAQAIHNSSDSSSSSSRGGGSDGAGIGASIGGGGLVRGGSLAVKRGGGVLGSNLFADEHEHGLAGSSELESADAFMRELLGLLENCMGELPLEQVYEMAACSSALGAYQRRRLLKHAAKALQAKVDVLQPEQLVRLMEEYSGVTSFWDRSLFYAATADIARRPQDFTADQLVRALHAVYASGATSPQLFDDMVSALHQAPRSTPAPQPAAAAGATQAATAASADTTPATMGFALPGAQGSSPPAAHHPWDAPAPLPAADASGWGAGRGGGVPHASSSTQGHPAPHAAAAGNGGCDGGAGLSLWQLQSVYSVLKAVEHPEAATFSQEFLEMSQAQPRPKRPRPEVRERNQGRSGGYFF